VQLQGIKAMKKKDFKDWQFEELNREFGYKRHYKNFELLETWLKADEPVNDFELQQLELNRENLFMHAEAWNEDELKFFFLSPLINLVSFKSEHYNPFTQRKMGAIIGDWNISGIVDFIIATGIQNPYQPYFFVHEYKSEKRKDNDPLGQLLAEMIVVQKNNEVAFPLYGCYVVGRFHFFVVLNDKEYSVSDAFSATNEEDILQIFKMFRFVKHEIDKHFE
jgi:hypothetical protein